MRDRMQPVFKIVRQREWNDARETGAFEGSPDDKRDGFLHFSTAGQLRETGAKHFSGETDLLLITVDAARLPFRWEVSRGGMEFPHLYGPLLLKDVTGAEPLTRDADGLLIFPLEIP